MFSVVELADLRAEHVASFDKSCVISTPGTPVDDEAGGSTAGSPTTATVACRVGPPTAQERDIAGRLGQELDAVITLPHDTTLPESASIAVSGETFQVVGTNEDQSYLVALRARVKQQGG